MVIYELCQHIFTEYQFYLLGSIMISTFLQIAIVMPAVRWLVFAMPQRELVFARKVLEDRAVINAFLGKSTFDVLFTSFNFLDNNIFWSLV